VHILTNLQLPGYALFGVMAIPLKRTASSPPSMDGKKHKDEDCVVCSAPAMENVMECVRCEARCAKISVQR